MIGPGLGGGVPLLLPDCLDVAARNWPNRLALRFRNQSWTFGDMARAVAGAAERIHDVSARSGRLDPGTAGRVGILSANRPGFVFAAHAARHLGRPMAPLNWRQTATEVAWQLEQAAVTVLLVDDERLETAARAATNLPVAVVPIAEIEGAAPAIASTRQPLMVPADQELADLFTSGTTGRPKGVRLTYGNVWSGAVASSLHLGHHLDDAWLAVLPLFHIGGLSILFRGALTGTPVHLHERFDPEHALAAMDAGASLVSLVPTMLASLLEARGSGEWPRTLRCVLLGGSATPAALIEACLARNIPVAPTYGLTEASSQVTTLLPSDVAVRVGSAGQPLPLTRLRVVTDAGVDRVGEAGQIEISGPTVFAGYLGETEPGCHFTGDGWFPTGDIGFLDGEGFLYVLDRRDDLIVSGGENISPAEIERVLLEHPHVQDAGVFGADDAWWGTRPAAAVVWTGQRDGASSALAEYCRQRLAPYKVPDRFLIVEALPRSPSGKLLRRVLRERSADPA